MGKSKISSTIDSVLLFIVASFFGVAVVGYFTSTTIVIIFSGIIVGLFVTKFASISSKKKKSDIDKKSYDRTMMEFYFKGSIWTKTYFLNALSKRYDVIDCNEFFSINDTAVFCHISPVKLTIEKMLEFYR